MSKVLPVSLPRGVSREQLREWTLLVEKCNGGTASEVEWERAVFALARALSVLDGLDLAALRMEQHAGECTRNGAEGHAAVLSEHAAELRALLPA